MSGARRLTLVIALVTASITASVALGQGDVTTGRIGEALGLLNNGRQLHPFGALTGLGNFPTGGAVTPDGRFYWTVSTGRGANDIRIVAVRSGQVVQRLLLPGASGGIVMDSRHPLVYVSGVGDSTIAGERLPASTPGDKGDVVHVFRYDAAGHATFDHVIAVPPPSSASVPQDFPPTNMTKIAWPDRLALSPDSTHLLVPLNLADAAAVVDVASGKVSYVATGNYPYGAAISRDSRLGFVSNETPGTVSVINMGTAAKVKDIQVGPHLSHPEAIVADPTANRVYVTVTNSDQVAVIDTGSLQVIRTLSVDRSAGLGTAPVALAVTPDGRQLVVAESGADELSVFSLRDFSLLGRIPTAEYPADVQVIPQGANPCTTRAPKSSSHRQKKKHRRKGAKAPRRKAAKHKQRKSAAKAATCAKLLYVSAKGLGTGPSPNGFQPNSPDDTDSGALKHQYLPLLNIGAAGIGDYPSDAAIAADNAVADQQVRPSNPEPAPSDTPLRPNGPIKHVFYIVRENRTYDQILGDVARGDGDPKLALFGGNMTPDVHAIVARFPLVDHFYANSEASIDGHFWTSAGSTSDYVHKNWFQNYAGRPRPYDFGVYAVTWPANGFLFDQATRQGISYFNYGEAIAGTVPLTDKDRTNDENQQVAQKFANSDLGTGATSLPTNTSFGGGAVALGSAPSSCYPNDASIGYDTVAGAVISKTPAPDQQVRVFDSTPPLAAPPGSESRFNCFQQHLASQLASGSVPTFNYLVLSNDHTRVLDPGAYTPAAMIADNDYALGQIVDAISHSSIWSSSAIFVTEDDSQDGPDHVDAHRTVGLVISPYTKPGAVVHTRYDMVSMIRSMELIMGMRPLYLNDALATPMYDAFQSTPSNLAPFTAVGPKVDLLATNPAAKTRAEARRLRFRGLDQITQRAEDRLLWRSVYGPASAPPPPGPNAVVEPAAGRADPNGN